MPPSTYGIYASVSPMTANAIQTARDDACKVEHDISDETFSAICRHLDTLGAADAAGAAGGNS